MKSPNLIIPAALVLAGVAGFIAGRTTSSSTSALQAGEQGAPAATRASRVHQQSAAESQAAGRSSRDGERIQAMTGSRRLERLESIVRDENPLERGQALLAYINQLGPGEFEEAVSHFRSLGLTESRLGEYGLLLSAWAKADPYGALAYATENTSGRFATDTILTTWASLDPLAAVQWAQGQHSGDGANPHMTGVIRGIAASDPELATRLITAMPRSRERGAALDAMIPHLLTQGVDATRAWIANLNDESLRSGAMSRVAERFAANDPAGTVSWLLQGANEATERSMDNVYRVWTNNDSAAAVASLAGLPAGDVRANAMRGVVSSVTRSDPQMAISLMNRYNNDLTDRVVGTFVWRANDVDPAAAAGQISRIQDEGYQSHMYRRMLGNWLDRDPSSAATWIRSNPLPDSVLNHLQRRMEAQP